MPLPRTGQDRCPSILDRFRTAFAGLWKPSGYNSFITSHSAKDPQQISAAYGPERGKAMTARIITITREFGSGGRTIGKKVAAELGYDFYDWNLVEKIAAKSGFAREFVEQNGEEQDRFLSMLASSSFSFNLNEQLFETQTRIILDLAKKGNCVLVGRCADFLLRNEQNALSCFIFANEESRKKRILEEYGERDESIDKRLRDKDRRRKAHYQYFTGRKWGKSFYYDLCLDTSRLPLDLCAQIIVEAARAYVPGQRMTNED